jgi:prepilin-type N-terminal cleavage/methylation domain-containing protein
MWREKPLRIEKGFTLLEVIVALGLSAIVMTALYSSFFLSRKAVDAVDDDTRYFSRA